MNLLLHQCSARCFDKGNRQLLDVGTDLLLIVAVFFSWFLFPVMLKFLAYTQFQVGFFVISVVVLFLLVRYSKLNNLDWSAWHKWFVFFWFIYLLFLLAASVRSGDLYSLKQYCITIYKALFFLVLLIYMKKNFIVWSFRLYSNFMVLVVTLACMVAIGVALEVMHPIQYFTDKVTEHQQFFKVYWGAYYFDGLRRMQGFCEEPGTFALTILPALFWLLIVEKGYFRAFIITIGVLASYSFGALVGLFLLLPLVWKKKLFPVKGMIILISMVALFVVIKYIPYISLMISGDFLPILDRFNQFTSVAGRPMSVLVVYEYLSIHPFGTGNALGMVTVGYPVSVGYANAMLEAGVVGGIAYCIMFGLLFWTALKLSLLVDLKKTEGRVCFVVAVSVMILVFMGAQRQQPDLSLWHMWIYASLFYLTTRVGKGSDVQLFRPFVSGNRWLSVRGRLQ